MKSINRIIADLPLGASALIEHKINNKNVSCIIVKDKFKNFMDAPWEREVHLKGGIIKKGNTLSVHIMVQVKDNFNNKLYPFHFNYYDENSLKILYNLTKQSEIYVIISNGNKDYALRTFKNSIQPFLKKYIKRSISFGYRWNDLEYKEALRETIQSFQDITELWNKLGDEIPLEIIKTR